MTTDNAYRGIWVFAEQQDGKLKGVSYELLAKGRELANALKTDLSAVLFGAAAGGADQLFAAGADKVYAADSPDLTVYDEDAYTQQLIELVQKYKPEILLAGATSLGRSFIPRVAAALNTGLAADCVSLDVDAEKRLLLQTRPTYGGNFLATILCETKRPQIATVRPRMFKKGSPDPNRKGETIKVDFNRASVASRTKLLHLISEVSQQVKLDEADIIVAGGRGMGNAENFKLLEQLAAALGAAVGASRPAVDAGWIPYSHQVGQTGKIVCPRLYIACGISGASQHLAGMRMADCIVAINNNPDAPIFGAATYGIVGDVFKVVPLLIEKLKK